MYYYSNGYTVSLLEENDAPQKSALAKWCQPPRDSTQKSLILCKKYLKIEVVIYRFQATSRVPKRKIKIKSADTAC